MKVIGGICDVQIDKTLSNYFKLEFEIDGFYFLLYPVANLTFLVNNMSLYVDLLFKFNPALSRIQ